VAGPIAFVVIDAPTVSLDRAQEAQV